MLFFFPIFVKSDFYFKNIHIFLYHVLLYVPLLFCCIFNQIMETRKPFTFLFLFLFLFWTLSSNYSIKGLKEITRQWKLSCKLIQASVEVAKCLDVRFIFLYRYYFSKASFFKMVDNLIGSFKSCDIWFFLFKKFLRTDP